MITADISLSAIAYWAAFSPTAPPPMTMTSYSASWSMLFAATLLSFHGRGAAPAVTALRRSAGSEVYALGRCSRWCNSLRSQPISKRGWDRTEALSFFEELSYTHRHEWARWVEDAKKSETRSSRVAKTVAALRDGKRVR